jgi:hypothetical protein
MPSPAKAHRDRLAFRDRLMRLRKSRDVYPWIAAMKKAWTPGATAVQEYRFQHQTHHDVFASELVHLNANYGNLNSGGTATPAKSLVPWDAQLMSGTDDRERASALVPADQLLGDSGVLSTLAANTAELKRFVTGLRLPPTEIFRILARTYPHPAGVNSSHPYNFEHSLWLAFRGYQLYAKGTTPTPQLTYSEFAERGYTPEKYDVVLSTTLADGVDATTEREATFTIPQAAGIEFHSTDFITLRTSATPGYEMAWVSQLLVKLEGFERPIMDDYVPAALLGNMLQRTAWLFPQPLTVRQGTQLKLRVKARCPITWSLAGLMESGRTAAVTVVLNGHNLVRQ